MTKQPVVISLGGSVLVPKEIDVVFLRSFSAFVRRLARTRRVAVICGGGAPARTFAHAAQRVSRVRPVDLHWIGIRATQLNAELLRVAIGVQQPVITSYDERSRLNGQIVIGAGRRPGASTDLGAVILAKALKAQVIYNLTNVDGVYTADPRRFSKAKRLKSISWQQYRRMFGRRQTPGMHSPFDPVASRYAERYQLTVKVVSKNLDNLQAAIAGRAFRGTSIYPA